MIRLERIVVKGVSSKGPFSGTLDLAPGLQVISARNSYGKSLVATAIVWCFGAEPMLGRGDDPGCFPLAVREEIELQGEKSKVLSSECAVYVVHSDGRRLCLCREICGNVKVVRVEETGVDGVVRSSRLNAHHETMKDERGGLQHFLVRWIGWPREEVATFSGRAAEVYVENLMPLFFIEQHDGWADLQARQVTRYGQQQIGQVTFEYLLGAIDAVRRRVAVQSARVRDLALRERARGIAKRVQTLFQRNGWAVEWSGNGSVRQILSRWDGVTLRRVLAEKAEVDLGKERVRLRELADRQRKALTTDPVDAANAGAPIGASQRVIELKERRHRINADLGSLRVQRKEAEELKTSLGHRIHAAKDVLRLKRTGVGRFDVVECPTCRREVAPESFDLGQQSEELVEAHIGALEKDREFVKKNVESLDGRLRAAASEVLQYDQELRQAERTLESINAATNTVREQVVEAAANLGKTEHAMDKLTATVEELAGLQSEIDEWANEATGALEVEQRTSDLEERVGSFSAALQNYLVELGHSAIAAENVGDVHVDENYMPYLGHRQLRSLGSASDRPRMVAAYTMALAAASKTVGGLHPGVVVLDEPLQQNPDESHRSLFAECLKKETLAKRSDFQTIIFTSLRGTEVEDLRAHGTSVTTFGGKRFLESDESAGR